MRSVALGLHFSTPCNVPPAPARLGIATSSNRHSLGFVKANHLHVENEEGAAAVHFPPRKKLGRCVEDAGAREVSVIRTLAQWDADMDQAPSILQTEKA